MPLPQHGHLPDRRNQEVGRDANGSGQDRQPHQQRLADPEDATRCGAPPALFAGFVLGDRIRWRWGGVNGLAEDGAAHSPCRVVDGPEGHWIGHERAGHRDRHIGPQCHGGGDTQGDLGQRDQQSEEEAQCHAQRHPTPAEVPQLRMVQCRTEPSQPPVGPNRLGAGKQLSKSLHGCPQMAPVCGASALTPNGARAMGQAVKTDGGEV